MSESRPTRAPGREECSTAAWITWAEGAVEGKVATLLFRTGNLSTVLGLRLRDGREVVLKARPTAGRHVGCTAVQRRLHEAGYPCPLPLVMTTLGDTDVTIETHVPSGQQLALDAAAPPRFAAALAQLVHLASEVLEPPDVDPPPPWAAWDHVESRSWLQPSPPDGQPQAPAWIARVARRAQQRLAADDSAPVVGHVDFESQNVRWVDGRLHCVHDWDSVAALSEPAIAGLAAAAFTATDHLASAASIRDSELFLSAYARARGRPWSAAELHVAWAAGVWVLAYNAHQASSAGDATLASRLALQAPERLRRADA